jgi:hypothetical protein
MTPERLKCSFSGRRGSNVRFNSAIAAIGAAVVVATGVAHAEEALSQRAAAAAEVPWYERFTFSGGQDLPQWSTANPRLPNGAAADDRWSLSIRVGEAERGARIEPIGPRDQTAIGAFYRFTPNVRVGGRVSVTEQPPVATGDAAKKEEPNTGVRLESAFRF